MDSADCIYMCVYMNELEREWGKWYEYCVCICILRMETHPEYPLIPPRPSPHLSVHPLLSTQPAVFAWGAKDPRGYVYCYIYSPPFPYLQIVHFC